MKKILLLLWLALASGWVHTSELTASVDRGKLYLSETLTLTLRYSGQAALDGPDLEQLQQQFDVLANSRSNQYRNVNGRVDSFTQWQLTLAPKRTGKLLIPSFELEGAFSDALEIEVTHPSQTPGTAGKKDIFLETELSKDKVFVQEQLLFTVRMYTSVSLQGFDPGDPTLANARVEQVADHQYRRKMQGRDYIVVERIYAIFPQTSGELTLPSVAWTVTRASQTRRLFDPFNTGRGSLQRLRSEERQITVIPKPGNYPDTTWLPAQEVTLTQNWSDSPHNFRVGEPITRTLTLTAKGLTAAQLPPLPDTSLADIKVYPDQPQTEDRKSNEGITGLRIESQAIVPTKSGTLVLPAVAVTWWDTAEQRMREASLPVQEITVAPASNPGPALPPPVVIDQTEPSISVERAVPSSAVLWAWQLSTLVFALLAAAFAMLWWRARQMPGTPIPAATPSGAAAARSETQAYRQLKQVCQRDDLAAIRAAVLLWAQQYWSNPHLTQIAELEERVDSTELKARLRALDAAMFGGESGTAWNARRLLDGVEALRKSGAGQTRHKGGGQRADLPPLYSN